jgi:RNA polymerase sigma-70 factor, ECF subfamily
MTAIAVEVEPVGVALQRARGGDHDAFAQLVAAHESMVYSVAYHFFNDRERAMDIAQDAFLQLYRSLADIENATHLMHWLRRVTARRCIDALRRSRFRIVSIEDVELSSSPSVRDPLLSRRMNQCIAALPEMQRILIVLRYQEELGPNDISDILDVPVNTVKSQLHRALRVLRKKLERS